MNSLVNVRRKYLITGKLNVVDIYNIEYIKRSAVLGPIIRYYTYNIRPVEGIKTRGRFLEEDEINDNVSMVYAFTSSDTQIMDVER